ncbi:extracellular solute-binding protein [Paenibacillus qinlingensis]|uniref:extracellular solute-binding protein n=1 Tax=Paenibacillus qinlingensis TaxID=1837343 RepID=UPI001567ADAC|nr:extracellular solute-binding protein [Paenibacillus qinlingensis]NQX58123.1 extracellular solute-binding protein [Paenibacillus qinlingensis]
MIGKPSRSTFRTRLEEMIASLRHNIVTGKLQPGDYLPSELMLAEQYNLSKNSIRKGLNQLLAQQMIEKVPRIGTRVIGTGLFEKLTLKFGYYPTLTSEVNLLQLVDTFKKQNPHIELHMIPLSSSYFTLNMQEVMERDGLDVLTLNLQNYEAFTDTGVVEEILEPLQPREGVYPFLLRPFTRAGNLYVQPFTFSPIILGYNKDHFREANLQEPDSSWSWEDVQRTARVLTHKNERFGLFFHLQSINRWPLFLLQNKVVFDRDECGKLRVDNEPFRESMRLSLQLFEGLNPESSYLSEQDSDCEMYFVQQKASMIVTSYYSLNHLRKAGFDYDIAPLPYSEEARTQLVMIGLALNRHSNHKQAAQVLIDFLLSDETQLQIRSHTLSLPSVKAFAEWRGQEEMSRPSRFMMYRDIIPTFRLYSDMNVTFRELETMRRIFKLYWARLDDFETVFRRLKEALQQDELG